MDSWINYIALLTGLFMAGRPAPENGIMNPKIIVYAHKSIAVRHKMGGRIVSIYESVVFETLQAEWYVDSHFGVGQRLGCHRPHGASWRGRIRCRYLQPKRHDIRIYPGCGG